VEQLANLRAIPNLTVIRPTRINTPTASAGAKPGSFSMDDREFDQKEHERALRRVEEHLAESGRGRLSSSLALRKSGDL